MFENTKKNWDLHGYKTSIAYNVHICHSGWKVNLKFHFLPIKNNFIYIEYKHLLKVMNSQYYYVQNRFVTYF